MKFIFGLILLFSTMTHADPGAFDRGNGGDVVICDTPNKTYTILDIYELDSMSFHAWTPNPANTNDPTAILEEVFTRIGTKYPVLAAKLRKEYYINFAADLSFTTPDRIPEVDDEGPVFLKPGCHLKQIAVQWTESSSYGKSYRIDVALWISLDAYNQAALLLHELMYRTLLASGIETKYTLLLRSYVAMFFSKEFDSFRGYYTPSYFY